MRLLFNYAALVRLPNLVIVILTEWLLYQYLLVPAYNLADIDPTLNLYQIFILALITTLLTAGGYIINDIIDFKIDLHNRPNKVIIGKRISIQVAYLLYFIVNVFGFVLAIYLALKTKNSHLIFLYPVALVGLYIYSTILKKTFAIDNLVVSLYCAGVAGIVAVAERHSINQLINDHPQIADYAIFIFTMYVIFAFLTTFIREIIKDMEDMAGDEQHGCSSIPIKFGIPKTKTLVFFLGITLMAALLFSIYYLRPFLSTSQLIFIFLGIIIPLIYELYQLWAAQNSQDYRRLSTFSKLTMLAGIFFILITSF